MSFGIQRSLLGLEQTTGAIFSPCRTYRYLLWRVWRQPAIRMCLFCGLNPSIGNETDNDPTITRCIDFAKRWDCDGLWMVNVFGFCATKPANMKKALDPIGPDNDAHLIDRIARSHIAIAAWGVTCSIERKKKRNPWPFRDRDLAVLKLPGVAGKLQCLRYTKDGAPEHPLYIPAETIPQPFEIAL